MLFKIAYIQEQGHGQQRKNQLRHEEKLITNVLESLDIPIEYYTEKRIHRRQLVLDSKSLVVGDMPCNYSDMVFARWQELLGQIES